MWLNISAKYCPLAGKADKPQPRKKRTYKYVLINNFQNYLKNNLSLCLNNNQKIHRMN